MSVRFALPPNMGVWNGVDRRVLVKDRFPEREKNRWGGPVNRRRFPTQPWPNPENLPELLNNWCDLEVILDLECPKSTLHIPFYDWIGDTCRLVWWRHKVRRQREGGTKVINEFQCCLLRIAGYTRSFNYFSDVWILKRYGLESLGQSSIPKQKNLMFGFFLIYISYDS